MGLKDVFKGIGKGFKNLFGGIGSAIVDIGVNYGLALITGALFKPKLKSAGQKGLQTTIQSAIEPRTVVYGQTRISGPWVFFEESNVDDKDDNQNTNKWLHGIIVLTTHPVEEITWVYIDGKPFDIRGCYSRNVKKDPPSGSYHGNNLYYADYFHPNPAAPGEVGSLYRGDQRRYIPDHEDFYTRFSDTGWFDVQFKPPIVPSPGLLNSNITAEKRLYANVWKKNLAFVPVTGEWIYKAHNQNGNTWANLWNDEDFTRSEEIRKIIQRAGEDYTYASETGLTIDYDTVPWNFNHRLERCSYLYVRFKYDKEYTRNIPNVSVELKGKRLYNPLADPTKYNPGLIYGSYSDIKTYYPGDIVDNGNGWVCIKEVIDVFPGIDDGWEEFWVERVHELPDYENDSYGVQLSKESTWTYSDNWALCVLDYLLDPYYGLKSATSGDVIELDWDAINKAVLDACDGGYFFRNPDADGDVAPTLDTSILDYVDCNGAFKVDASPMDILETLLAAGLGELAYAQGRHHLFANTYREPDGDPTDGSAIIFDESYIADGGISVGTAFPTSEIFNTVTGTYMQVYDPKGSKKSYDPVEFDPIRHAVYIAQDEEELPKEVSFPFTQDKDQAEKLAALLIEKPRRSFTIEANCNVKAWKFKVGDIVYVSLDRLGLDDTLQNCYTIDNTSPYTTSYKQFKVVNMKFNENATVDVSLQEQDLGVFNPDLVPNDPVPNTGDLLLSGQGTQANPPTNLSANNLWRYGPDGTTTSYVKLTFDGPNLLPVSPYGADSLNYNYDSIAIYRIKWTKRINLTSPIDGNDINPDGDPWTYGTIIANRIFDTSTGVDACRQAVELFDLENNEEYVIAVQAVPERGVPSDWYSAYIFHNTIALNTITITSVDAPANGLGYIVFDVFYNALDFDILDKLRVWYNHQSPYEQPTSPFEPGLHEGVRVFPIATGEVSPVRIEFPTNQNDPGKFWFQLVDKAGNESNIYPYTEFAQAGTVELSLARNQFHFIGTGLSVRTATTTSAASQVVGRTFLDRTDLSVGDYYGVGANIALNDYHGGSPAGGAFVKLEWFDNYDVSLGSVSTNPETTQGSTVKYVEGTVPADAYYFIVTIEKEATLAAVYAYAYDYMVTQGPFKFYRPPIDERFLEPVIDPYFEDEYFWTGDYSIQYGAGTTGGLMRINQQVGTDSVVYALRRSGPDFWDTTAIDYDRIKVKVRFRWVGGGSPDDIPEAFCMLKVADASWDGVYPNEGANVVELEQTLGIRNVNTDWASSKTENTWYEQAVEFSIDNSAYGPYQRSFRVGFKVLATDTGNNPGYIEIDTVETLVLPRDLPQTPWVPDPYFENADQWWTSTSEIVSYDPTGGINGSGAMLFDFGISPNDGGFEGGIVRATQRSPDKGFLPREQDQLATVGMTLSCRFRVWIPSEMNDIYFGLDFQFHDYYGFVTKEFLVPGTGTTYHRVENYERDQWVEINEPVYIPASLKLANPDRNLNFQAGFSVGCSYYQQPYDWQGIFKLDMLEIEPMAASFGPETNNDTKTQDPTFYFKDTGLVPLPPYPYQPLNPDLFLREDGVWANPAGTTTAAPAGGYTTETQFSSDGSSWSDTWSEGQTYIRTRENPNIDITGWPTQATDIPLPHQVGRWAGRWDSVTFLEDRRRLRFTHSGANYSTPTNFGAKDNKLYAEFIMEGHPSSNSYYGFPMLYVNCYSKANTNVVIKATTTNFQVDQNVAVFTQDYNVYNTGVAPIVDSAGFASERVSIAIDLERLKCWIAINGTWVGSGTQDPATGVGGWTLEGDYAYWGATIWAFSFSGANDRDIVVPEEIIYPPPYGFTLACNPTLSGLLKVTSGDPRANDVPLLLTFENPEADPPGEEKLWNIWKDRSIYSNPQIPFDQTQDNIGYTVYNDDKFTTPSGGNALTIPSDTIWGSGTVPKTALWYNELFAIPEIASPFDNTGDFTVECVVRFSGHNVPGATNLWQIGGTGQSSNPPASSYSCMTGRLKSNRDPIESGWTEGAHRIDYTHVSKSTNNPTYFLDTVQQAVLREQWHHIIFERETNTVTGVVTWSTVDNGVIINQIDTESDSATDHMLFGAVGHDISKTPWGCTQFLFGWVSSAINYNNLAKMHIDQVRMTVNGARYGLNNWPTTLPDKKWSGATIEDIKAPNWTTYNTCCGDSGDKGTSMQFSSGDGNWHDNYRQGDTLARLVEFTSSGNSGDSSVIYCPFKGTNPYDYVGQNYSLLSTINTGEYLYGSGDGYHNAYSDIIFDSGKYYFEHIPHFFENNYYFMFGITAEYRTAVGNANSLAAPATHGGFYWRMNGRLEGEDPSTYYQVGGFNIGDVVQLAVDFDSLDFWVGKNGVWAWGDPGDYENSLKMTASPSGKYRIYMSMNGEWGVTGQLEPLGVLPGWNRMWFKVPLRPLISPPSGFNSLGSYASSTVSSGESAVTTNVRTIATFPIGPASAGTFIEFSDDGSTWHSEYEEGDTYARIPTDPKVNVTTAGNSWSVKDSYWHDGIFDNATSSSGGELLTTDGWHTSGKHYWEVNWYMPPYETIQFGSIFITEPKTRVVANKPAYWDDYSTGAGWTGYYYGASIGLLGPETGIADRERTGNVLTYDINYYIYKSMSIQSRLTYHYNQKKTRFALNGTVVEGTADFWENDEKITTQDYTPMKYNENWGVAVDIDNGLMWIIGNDGTVYPSGSPASGTGGYSIPAGEEYRFLCDASIGSEYGAKVLLESSSKLGVPSGFTFHSAAQSTDVPTNFDDATLYLSFDSDIQDESSSPQDTMVAVGAAAQSSAAAALGYGGLNNGTTTSQLTNYLRTTVGSGVTDYDILSSTPFSVKLHAKWDGTNGSQYQWLFGNGVQSARTTGGFGLVVDTVNFNALLYFNSASARLTVACDPNTYGEFLIERDASNVIRFYWNGVYLGKFTDSSAIPMEGILIGSANGQTTNHSDWNGYIDEVIWMPDLSSPKTPTPFASGSETAYSVAVKSFNTTGEVSGSAHKIWRMGGAELFFGTGTPSTSLGKIGDVYTDTSGKTVYQKTALTTWTSRYTYT